jgi:TonB-dependent starch-binding outer membrane protein SusC
MKRILIILLFWAGGALAAFAQQQIQGKVTDDKGRPLESVSVTIKGTNNGATTNNDGSFVIKTNISGKTGLTFSYTGYKTIEVSSNGSTPLSVKLEIGENKLEDVVVVGYGTRRQKDVTGSISSVTSKDFNQGAVLSPQQAIQGKVTGVNISQNSGKPGGSNTIRIRGGTSLTGSNDPLYVIDGIPISSTAGVAQANIRGNGTDVFDQEPSNPLMTLNPDDIESVTVLKDASATAIYGSRAANGVIVIY